mgnify:FL=1
MTNRAQFQASMAVEDSAASDDSNDITALGSAVVSRALADVFRTKDGRPAEHRLDYEGVAGADAREAYLFLTATSGPWKRSREHWCLVANIRADAVRSYTLKHEDRLRAAGYQDDGEDDAEKSYDHG